MLRPMEPSEFGACVDFAYPLALNPARSGYPTWCDGIKTREDFIGAVRKTFSRPDKKALLFTRDGQTEGLIAFDCLEEDRYLHPYVFNIRRDTGTALAEFVDYCRTCWPGFTVDFGFPAENVEAIGWLDEQGIPCNERSWNFLLDLDRYEPLPEPSGVTRITAENFEDFAAIHRRIGGDMYWNCQRVRRTLKDWAIFVTGEGDCAGEVLMTLNGGPHQEIFALGFVDGQYHGEDFQALLTAALNCLKEKGTRWLTFFVDEGCSEGEALRQMGFHLVGTYAAYRAAL